MTRRAAATERLTVGQALVRFLAAQRVERDGLERPFFAGVFGIFGHGNVAGIGQALQQYAGRLRYYQSRNEQAQVHTAAAYARMTNRLQTLACTSSVGPGATNMITGAAGATTALVTVGPGSPGAALADLVVLTDEQDQSWCHTVGYLAPIVAGVALAAKLRRSRLDAAAIRALLDVSEDAHGPAEIAVAMAGTDRLLVAGAGRDAITARELKA